MLADASAVSTVIAARLDSESTELAATFGKAEPGAVRYCAIDNLLPDDLMLAAFSMLPALAGMLRLKNLKERKFVTAEIDALAAPIRHLILALNSRAVADVVARIIGVPFLEADPKLYNSGITTMVPGDFMCPHLDNSHDYDRGRRRVVALLYYFSPYWRHGYGGDLELWGDDRRGAPRAIEYRGNRLVIMETTDLSWHSVQPIVGPMPRVNAIAYFYAPSAEQRAVRLTRFAAWPGQRLKELLFDAEFHLRTLVARLAGRRLRFNRHLYTGRGGPAPEPEPQDLPAPEQP
ncbi:MAG: 2OG-Fe(II) oxygenase [Candidatus Eiseniibacteriota bacterium]